MLQIISSSRIYTRGPNIQTTALPNLVASQGTTLVGKPGCSITCLISYLSDWGHISILYNKSNSIKSIKNSVGPVFDIFRIVF